MRRIQKLGERNNLSVESRRYSLSDLISESYRILYDCEAGSKIYRLAESHISNISKNPSNISSLSEDLCILKKLASLGESAIIRESDITDYPIEDEDLEEEFSDEETLDEESPEEEELSEEESPEEEELSEEEEEVPEEDGYEEEEVEEPAPEEDPEISPEELQELKKHLEEIRKVKKMKESKEAVRSWKSEHVSMKSALKHFRESSSNKAFYNTFNKMNQKLSTKKSLTIQESILLYKAANSAMTQLTVELEHNPEFIYTFKECTELLSKDTKSLLGCIRENKSPSPSLMESLYDFSNILLESEEVDDEEEEVKESEELKDAPEDKPLEEEVEAEEVVEEEVEAEEETLEEEETEEESVPTPDEVVEEEMESDEEEEEVQESEEDTVETEETPEEEEISEEESAEEYNGEITEEEAEELRKKLTEIRKSKKLSK